MSSLHGVLSSRRIRILGLVLDKCDKIMHGMVLGTAGMHNQVSQWSNEGGLCSLVDLLHEHGFSVFLTSDHGNVEARGIGRQNEGVLTQSRGRRATIYNDQGLRSA
ncbi:MAG: PglZ domain-containing protein, partial [Anaerolineae bacterium]|nr:PglZ domain-containing protein [Anaerolineae bacterium]